MREVSRARRRTWSCARALTPEDMMVQSCPEASPAKWHLAHTAWFFESFVLREFLPGYQLFNGTFPGSSTAITRAFRRFLRSGCGRRFRGRGSRRFCAIASMWIRAMERLLEREPEPEALRRIELGANHEEQHQELLLTDILNAFFHESAEAEVQGRGTKGPREQKRGSEGARERASAEPRAARIRRI